MLEGGGGKQNSVKSKLLALLKVQFLKGFLRYFLNLFLKDFKSPERT